MFMQQKIRIDMLRMITDTHDVTKFIDVSGNNFADMNYVSCYKLGWEKLVEIALNQTINTPPC